MLLLIVLCCLGSGLGAASPAVAADPPGTHADYGPDSGKPPPEKWAGDQPGVDSSGNWCALFDAEDCRPLSAAESPGGTGDVCEGADGTASAACNDKDAQAFETRRLEKWRTSAAAGEPDFAKLDKVITACVKKGGNFEDCHAKGRDKYPQGGKGPGDWISGKISALAGDALKEAAEHIGAAVVWLLEAFADVFNSSSTIDLGNTGIGKVTALTTALSAVLATFLLLLQFGKVGLSQSGEPAATAVIGLAKWAVISSVYLTVTQTALSWSDAVSTWIINYSFSGGGSGTSDATEAMQEQLGALFSGLVVVGGGTATAVGAIVVGKGLAAAAVAVVIVVGIICILAIAALWIEVLLRQAGIMIIMATMPITLAGQLSEPTSEWWPKARNALIALILMKPAIVLCFSIGFFAMAEGNGIQNVIVGLVIFLLACFAWPVLAKFMVFTTNGAGSSMASGLISSVGSSASSTLGGYQPDLGGAGMVGGGSGYTRALEKDTAQTASNGSNGAANGAADGASGSKGGARFGSKVGSNIALGLQLAAVGKDALESGMANTAAHAGLDSAGGGGRHVVIARGSRGSGDGSGAGGGSGTAEESPPADAKTSADADKPPPEPLPAHIFPPATPYSPPTEES
ncbi:hypothetical protein [Streptomyces sp. NPDC050428]|uniref:hypothetical protein n=1 Tax=Streptomyces sp. NPDC050428 TaxID=3155757 RepID=UPI003415A8F7